MISVQQKQTIKRLYNRLRVILQESEMHMKYFLSHESAAFELNVPHVESVFGVEKSEMTNTHITTTSRKYYRKQNGYVVHFYNDINIPKGSVDTFNGQNIVSVNLLFYKWRRDYPYKA